MTREKDYTASIELLRKASTPLGFVASVQEHDNYKRVWTRDGTIISLAALLTEDKDLVNTAKQTVQTIMGHQHPTGFMPSNVAPDGKVSYGGTVGRADNPSWAVIGLCQYTLFTGEQDLAAQYRPQVEKCFSVMDAWEYNGKHLLYVPQSGDWADEYIQHGYVLFNQLLRVWALQLAARVYGEEAWLEKSRQVITVIQTNFWNNQDAANLYAPNLKHQLEKAPLDFWFLGFNPARIYSQFDLQANALALLLGIGDHQQNATLLELIESFFGKQQDILPSFYPTIDWNDPDMAELRNNYAYSFRNKPNEFHNGGLWPVWNGWMVAALEAHGHQRMADAITESIAVANRKNNYEFNECLHGESREPIGVPYCTWSAAGFVIADNYLKGKRFFTQ